MKNRLMLSFLALFALVIPATAQTVIPEQHEMTRTDFPQPVATETDSSGKTTYVDFIESDVRGILATVIITKASVFDFQCIPNPGNPPTGNVRLYCDSLTGLITALNSNGGNALGGNASNPVTSGLLGQYNMTEISGTTIASTGGTAGPGTLGCTGGASPSFVGAPTFGLLFSGGQCVTLPAALNATQTVVLYVNHPTATNLFGFTGGECPVASNGNGAANVGIAMCLQAVSFYTTYSGVEKMTVLPNGSGGSSISSDIFVGTGSLGFILASSGGDQFYINGVLTTDIAVRANNAGVQSSGAYILGGSSAGNGLTNASFYNGTIYMAAFYNRVLSTAEMAAVHGWMANTMLIRGAPINLGSVDTGSLISLEGDSLLVNGATGQFWANQYLNWGVGATLNDQFTTYNNGLAGATTCQQQQTQFNTQPGWRGTNSKNVALVWLGANDIGTGGCGTVPGTTGLGVNRLASICNNLHKGGFKCIVGTLPSHTGAGVDTLKNQWNTIERASWSTFADGLADFAANPNIGADGAFANGTYFQGDGIHLTNFAMNTIIAPMSQHAVDRAYGNTTMATATTYRVGGAATPTYQNQFQQSSTTSGTTSTVAMTNTHAGDFIFCIASWFTAATVTPTDSQTNAWSSVAAIGTLSDGTKMQAWFTPNIVGGSTDTITFTYNVSAVNIQQSCVEYSGVLTVAPLDQAATIVVTTGGATQTSGNITNANANDINIGYIYNDNGNLPLANSTYYQTSVTGNSRGATSHLNVAATGTYSTTFTNGAAGGNGAGIGIASFKAGVYPATIFLLDSDVSAICDPGGGNITLNLQDAIGLTGQTVTIKNLQLSGLNTCTVAPINSETIDGSSLSVIIPNGQVFTFTAKLVSPSAAGANWITSQSETNFTGGNCSSSASPAVCGAATAGSVAVPTGATPTLQINTTAVTANSQIQLNIDEGLGTKLGVTCNSTLATLVQPVVTARTPGTSFTIQINATLAVNPACVSYSIIN